VRPLLLPRWLLLLLLLEQVLWLLLLLFLSAPTVLLLELWLLQGHLKMKLLVRLLLQTMAPARCCAGLFLFLVGGYWKKQLQLKVL